METPKSPCNVFRIRRNGRMVELSLGTCQLEQRDQNGRISSDAVTEMACAEFDVEMLKAISSALIVEGLRYQKETGEDVGFPPKGD